MYEAVRPALPADVPALAHLLAAARMEAAPRRGGALLLAGGGVVAPADPTSAGRPPAVLAAWMAEPTNRVVLSGCLDDVVVGLASGHLLTGGGGAPLGVVDCCYVDLEARQVGIGAAMAAALVEWFTEKQCRGIDAPALPGDRSTKQLWETAGFSARLIVLHRPLG